MPPIRFTRKDLERMKASLIGIANGVLNLAANYVWTGDHTFEGDLVTRDVYPQAADTYDIGKPEKRYRTIRAAELAATLFSKEQVMVLGNKLILAQDQGTLPAEVQDSDTQIDFGQSMTVGDWVMIAAEDLAGSPALEWLLVGSNVSGTTYNVTRNVDGSGANDWAEGTPFLVIGADGDYRIELSAGSTPSLKLIKQGATWNTYTEEFLASPTELSVDDASLYFKYDGSTSARLYALNNASVNGLLITTEYDSQEATIILRSQTAANDASTYIDAFSPSSRIARILLQGLSAGNTRIVASTDKYVLGVGGADQETLFMPGFHHDPLGPWNSYPGLQALWHGYGYRGSGSTALMQDRSGMEHDLTISGAVSALFVPSHQIYPSVGVIDFDGTNDYAYRASETVFSGARNNLDLLILFKLDALPTVGTRAVLMQNGVATNSWILWVESVSGTYRVRFSTVNAAGTTLTMSQTDVEIAADTWYLTRAQYVQGSLFAITVNEARREAGTIGSDIRAPSGNFQIARYGTASEYLNGQVFAAALAINDGSDNRAYLALYHSIKDIFNMT